MESFDFIESGIIFGLQDTKALKQFRGFIDMYDPSPYFVMFVFKVPLNYVKNYKLILKGKYSEVDPDYKAKLLEFHGYDIHGELAQILFKSEKRRIGMEKALKEKINPKAELYSMMDIEDETFNPKIYI